MHVCIRMKTTNVYMQRNSVYVVYLCFLLLLNKKKATFEYSNCKKLKKNKKKKIKKLNFKVTFTRFKAKRKESQLD